MQISQVVLPMWKHPTNYLMTLSTEPQSSWSLKTIVNTCDTTQFPHYQPVKELCMILFCTLQPSPPSLGFHKCFEETLQGISGFFRVSTTNWHLPRALWMTEQQRHLPSASMETEPHAAIAVALQQSLREFRVVWGIWLQGIWWDRSLDSWMFLGTDLWSQSLHLLISRETLNPFMVTSDPHD